jgi:single-strand DNA-binding protein
MSANITVIGNLASDPELRFTKDGKAVCSFTVITSTSKKNLAGEWESTDATPWRVTAWDKIGEHASESLTKGSQLSFTEKRYWNLGKRKMVLREAQ